MHQLKNEYQALVERPLKLDLTRGKPSPEQLDLSRELLEDTEYMSGKIDARNYGHLEGLPEARELFAEYLGTPVDQTFVLGNSSLRVMHDIVVQSLLTPLPFEWRTWKEIRGAPSMLCPVPGYDRHHEICARYGLRMIPITMHADGPDMDEVRRFAAEPNVVGMWNTPKYSNPSGITYASHVCEEIASMQAASYFRIFWDLAYNAHHLTEEPDTLPDMLALCKEAENPDRTWVIGSTSKMTYASAGCAMVASSPDNMEWLRRSLSVQSIGPDKLNQLRHVRFFKDAAGIKAHMKRHREIVGPKFDLVDGILERDLVSLKQVHWTKPRGGYFLSLFVPGVAKEIVAFAGKAGVALTPAGAAYPYGHDRRNEHIRIAPSFAPLHNVRRAMEVLTLSVRLAYGM